MCTVFAIETDRPDLFKIEAALKKTESRGPDDQRIAVLDNAVLGFQRLSIMGVASTGMQPFFLGENAAICNGEIYGFRPMKEELQQKGYQFVSESDCEILLPLYEEYGTDMFAMLDAEYACVIYDGKSGHLIAARDPIGIRPLHFGYTPQHEIVFASEAKNLVGLVDQIFPFPPGHYYKDGEFICYRDMREVDEVIHDDLETVCQGIHDRLVDGVLKRLDSDMPVGYLLSGGLDSSLVCAIGAAQSDKPIETFAIGMDTDAIDLKYARQVAEYIGSNHHELIMTEQEVLDTLEEVIAELGTFDITTIRASMGMYLICKKIHQISDIRVLMTGEISDELFGYKYTDFAPNAEEFQKESEKRVHELHMYDVLRADRCISTHSMEARVPFGDLEFVKYVMAIDPAMKMNTYNMGKYLLRHAFEADHLLPESILFRQKAAFSDAVGHSMADDLKAYAEAKYTDAQFAQKASQYTWSAPFTKESLLYREIFEKYYPGQAQMIAGFWMPNPNWEGCNVNDPSARVLSNYDQSGN